MSRITKNWQPKSIPEIDAMKGNGGDSYREWERLYYYSNGYSWAKGNCNSHTIQGNKSIYWKLGFWRGGGRRPPLVLRQTYLDFGE